MPRRRLLLLDLAGSTPIAPRIWPLVVVPLPDGQLAVPLTETTPEEALAILLAGGLPIRRSRLIES
ncbi:MAG: hypothetical protein ABJC19_11905 [Gemmatimonadota bacterium]